MTSEGKTEEGHIDWQHYLVAMVASDLQRALLCDFGVTPVDVDAWRRIVTAETFEAYCGQYYSYACDRAD